MKTARLLSAALAEFRKAALHYENEQAGLGSRFVEAIEATAARICENPDLFPPFQRPGLRRCLVHTFPYALIFRQEPGGIEIIAVMHLSRRPGYWTSRIR